MTKSSERAVPERTRSRAEADELARAIATAAAEQILHRVAETEASGLPFTGEFDVEVKYLENTYRLKVSGPSTGNNNAWVVELTFGALVYILTVNPPPTESTKWSFSLARRGASESDDKAKLIAEFIYQSAETWKTYVGLPEPIAFGSFTISQLSMSLGRGTIIPEDLSSLLRTPELSVGAAAGS